MNVSGNGVIKVGDIDIGYRAFGRGDPLLLIMGYGSTMNMWEDRLIQALSKNNNVIIFDNRGMGETSAGQKDFSLEQFASDSIGLIDALKLKKVSILGWSMGSYIAQEIVARYPDRVDKLVLYASTANPNLFPPSKETLSKLNDTSGTPQEQGSRWISLLFPNDWLVSHGDRIKEIFYRPLGTINPESIGKQSIAISKWTGLGEKLVNIKNKTLLIGGKEDVIVPPNNLEYLDSKIPDATLTLVESTGHGLMFQDPDKFVQLVLEFLD